MPVLSVLILIFVVWLHYEMRKAARLQNKATDDFWTRENQSNETRRKDISGLSYMIINPDSLPLTDKADQTINSYRDTVLKLAGKKAINLTGYSNTELKSRYGAANMTLLTEYENNYIILVSILYKWADRLLQSGDPEDSKTVLEYAVSLKTDVTGTYLLLADIYKTQNAPEKIEDLIHILDEIPVHDRDKLILQLKKLALQ